MAQTTQNAILAPNGTLARVLVFQLCHADTDPLPGLGALCAEFDSTRHVLGLGLPFCARLGAAIDGLRAFPALAGAGCAVPSTQGALFCALLGDDRGDLLHASRRVTQLLGAGFRVAEVVDMFTYREGRDLSGYIDGTENPQDQAAVDAAVVHGRGPGLDGGSFVAVQRWVHDFDALAAKTQAGRDAIIGRSAATNQELGDAPASAHVKRAAQESFEPPAFLLRRSMPYVGADESGLFFVAYGESLERFERVLRRMLGLTDGVVDALFEFTRAVSGGYYFCPPLHDGRIDLRAMTSGRE